MDIYEKSTRDTYVQIENYFFNKNIKKGRYFYIRPMTAKSLDLYYENRKMFESFNMGTQLYNIIIDIDNNGTKESVIKKAQNRYVAYFNRYYTSLTVFKNETRKNFKRNKDIDSILSEKVHRGNGGRLIDLFIFKNNTYIKQSL